MAAPDLTPNDHRLLPPPAIITAEHLAPGDTFPLANNPYVPVDWRHHAVTVARLQQHASGTVCVTTDGRVFLLPPRYPLILTTVPPRNWSSRWQERSIPW